MSQPDLWWEAIKLRFPSLRDFDQIRDQTHTHHTLVIGLVFGTLGWIGGLTSGLGHAAGYALGVGVGCLIAYPLRERWPVRWFMSTDTVDKWDGTLDVWVPWARLLPFALACWLFAVPLWLILGAQLLQLGEGLGYTVLRPKGSLFYGGHGLREDVCHPPPDIGG